jgi:PAS domain S-box-containing protein
MGKSTPRNILLLVSSEAELPASQQSSRGVYSALNEVGGTRYVTYTEYLDLVRFPESNHQEQLATFLQAKYAGVKFDVVITSGPPALDFITKQRHLIAPDVPIVFTVLGQNDYRKRTLPPKATGILSQWNFAKTLELAHLLQPTAKNVVIASGSATFDHELEILAREALHPFEAQYSFTYLSGLPLSALLQRTQALPPDTILFVISFFKDPSGERYLSRDVTAKIATSANAPTYTIFDTTIGFGVTGGYMDTFEAIGKEAGHVALGIIAGENPDNLVPYVTQTNRYLVDWRELERWHLKTSALPTGTEIRFRPMSAWEQYKVEIVLVLIALILQTALIFRLYSEARKRLTAEREATASKERMNAVITAVDVGLWDWDVKSNRIWATKSCRDIFGLNVNEELTRQSFESIVYKGDRRRVASEIDKKIEEGLPFETEYRVQLPNGMTRWTTTKGSPIGNQGGESFRVVGVVIDATARKKAEVEAEQQRTEIAHLSRVSVLGALSGALAHELNQPLTAILSNAQAATRILKRKPSDLGEIRQILEDIVQDDKRASSVIIHLRALLKGGKSAMKKISINDLISDTLVLAHSYLILKDIVVSTRFTKNIPGIFGDPIQLQQVLLNLFVNACDAMSLRPMGDRLLVLETALDGKKHVRISVTDSGDGLPPDNIQKVFDPFFTTKSLGLGLGLPICRSIVSAHDGRLWAEPAPVRGAAFHIVLPIRAMGLA